VEGCNAGVVLAQAWTVRFIDGGKVSGTDITEAAARERAALIGVHAYQVSLDLGVGPNFATRTRVRFQCRTPGAETWIDLIANSVEAITLNGRDLDPRVNFVGNRILLTDLASENELEVVASCNYMQTGEGMHRFVDPVDDEVYLYTQFESSDARRVFACFEQPDLKATFQIDVTAPDYWTVVSNAATPVSEATTQGRAIWRFAATPRISTYICAVVAGPYYGEHDEYVGPNGTYPMSVYCRASLASHLDAADIFLTTKQGMAYFEEQFQRPYPFGKYDQSFVPEFNAGAMENAGCVTHHESYLFRARVTDAAYEQRSNTILHELAHMWFGDLVTMRWWDDLWLNESFAEWASHDANVKATRFPEAWTTFLIQRKAWAYRQDQLASTHPIYTEIHGTDYIASNFDGITYAKGAATLRQLVAWVGEPAFFSGLQAYFEKHAWGNTELADLLTELSAASGRNLEAWSQEWLTTAGVNLLRPIIDVDSTGAITRLAVEQEPPTNPPGLPSVLRSHRLAIGCYDHSDTGLVRTARIEVDIAGPLTEVPELTGRQRPALLLLNDDDLTYAKIRLDPASLQAVITGLPRLHRPMPRALIWGAAWDMTRDAEMTTAQFLQLVLAGLPDETDIAITQQLISQVRQAIDSFAAPDRRASYLIRLGQALRTQLDVAAPGSDQQLALLRGFAATAESDADLAFVAQLRDGGAELPGLVIDTELRWALLHRLIITGQANGADISGELARDETAAGQRHAKQAYAARPTAEAKHLAWAEAVEGDALTNSLLSATVAGFMQRDQVELLTEYRERYFAEIPIAWRRRTHEMAFTVGAGLFPSYLIDETTVALTTTAIDDPDQPEPLRRLMVEGRDGVQRALRARSYDGATPPA